MRHKVENKIIKSFHEDTLTGFFRHAILNDPDMVSTFLKNKNFSNEELADILKEKFDSRGLVQYTTEQDVEVRLLFLGLASSLKTNGAK